VIGVTADGAIAPAGLLTSTRAVAGTPAQSQPPNEFFLRVAENVSYRAAATGIPLTFPENGVKSKVLGDEERTALAVRSLLDTMIRGFLGMGLASGIAALGVVGMRSVAERRQQIGMLRARLLLADGAGILPARSPSSPCWASPSAGWSAVLARNGDLPGRCDYRELRLVVPAPARR
jgi:hypothetical protein